MDQVNNHFASANIDRDRDQFLRELLRELATVLEEPVGIEESEGFIAMVGNRIGDIPFGSYVRDRESLCMMTSNVFGKIASSNLGYARVVLEETIAKGDAGCRVVVNFGEGAGGREYYG